MALLIINIDDETGWPQRLATIGEERMGELARVTHGAIYSRYKAMQRDLAARQHEQDAQAAEALMREATPANIRRMTRKVG